MNRFVFSMIAMVLLTACAGVTVANPIDSLKNIVVTVTFSAPPASYTVTKAPLRYNKSFAYSFQIDDGGKDIYTHGYPFFEGGTVAGTTFPGLRYTDGCGNDHFFKMSSSLFSFSTYGGGETDMHDPASAYAPLNVTWPEVIELYQHGWGVSNHGLTSSTAGSMDYDLARNHSYVKLKTQAATPGGINMGVFVNPNGAEAYTPVAFSQGYLVCYRIGYPLGDPSFDVNSTWDHNQVKMGRSGVGNSARLQPLVTAMATASSGTARHWGVHITHAVNNGGYGYDFATFQTDMNFVANTYGKGGLDNIWMTTEEEILDYLLVKDAITPNAQLNGNVLTITFSGSIPSTYRFYTHSLKVNADQPIASVAVSGVKSVTYNGTGTNSSLINLAWDGYYVVPPEVNAELWVSKTETTHSQEDAKIAMDYVLMVPAGPVQQAFRLRLCTVTGVSLPASFCNMRNAPVTTVGSLNACPGTQFSVPVLVSGFTNITSSALRLDYDPSKVTFVTGSAAKPTVLTGMQIAATPVGGGSALNKITIAWSSATAKSLSAADTLCKLYFNTLSGSLPLTFNTDSGGGSDCEYKDENGNVMIDFPVATYFINGRIENLGLPAPGQIAGPASVCPGTSGHVYSVPAVAGATSYSWTYPAGFSGVSGQTSSTTTLSAGPNAVSGTVAVRAINTCTGNPLSQPYQVTVAAKPDPSISGTATVCSNSSGHIYTTQAGMTNYQWSVTPGGTITSGQGSDAVQVAWVPVGTQSVSVTYTGPSGCTAPLPGTRDVNILVRPVPTLTGDNAGCVNAQMTFYTEPGNFNYQWTIPPAGVIVSGGGNSQSVTVRWIIQGSHTVSVNYYNSNGCNALQPASKSVMIYNPPTPGIVGAASLCAGTNNLIYSTDPGMTGYVWEISAGGTITSGSTTSAITVNWNTAGDQTLKVNYTTPAGCSAPIPSVRNITVRPRPVPTVSGAVTVCEGSTGVAYTTEPGMTAYQWTVSPGGTIISGQGSGIVQVNWNLAGPRLVAVNYTSGNGCNALTPSSYPVTVHPLPVPGVIGADTLCSGDTITYSTDQGMTGYQWSVSPGGVVIAGSGSSSIDVAWITPGNGFISVSYVNSQGCSGSGAPWPVLILNRPSPVIQGIASACAGSSPITYMTENGMSNYQWSISPGGTIVSGGGTYQVNVLWNLPGAQQLGVSYQNPNGCTTMFPTIKNVTVVPPPVPVISGFDSVCVNSMAWYFTESGMTNYQWTISSGGTIVAGGTGNMIQVLWSGAGNKTVTVIYTSPDGCTAAVPSSKQVKVYVLNPTISGAGAACTGATGVIYTTQPGMINYNWNVTSGGTITSGLGTNSIQVNWNNAGLQSVSVNYSGPGGCTAPAAAVFPVTVNAPPVPSVAGPSVLCVNSGLFVYTTEPGMTGYTWTVSSGGVITGGSGTSAIQVQWTLPGTQHVDVLYTGSNGCLAVMPGVLNVAVNPLPAAAGLVSGPASICKPLSGAAYSITPVAGATGYAWNLPPGVQIINGVNTPAITVSFSSTAQSGDIAATGVNSCGIGAFSPSLNVAVNPYPATPAITIYDADTLISSADTGNQWYLEGHSVPGATAKKYHFIQSGAYFVIVTLNNCRSDTSNILHAVVTGFPGHPGSDQDDRGVVVFPNPASDYVMITGSTLKEEPAGLEITIVDMFGHQNRLVSQQKVTGVFSRKVDVSQFPEGCYAMKVNLGGRSYIVKLLLRRQN